MPAITAQHLAKSFGPQLVLDDATFTLTRGEKVALVGANGAGKSTLARILAGIEPPDGGTVSLRRGLTVRYVAQEPTLDPHKSARQVVLDALPAEVEDDGRDRAHEALDFLDRLGVRDVDRPTGERSGGERRRIALAQLLVTAPDVAIVDEPTNHLDAETIEWLEVYLATRFRGAVLLVTHDRYFLDAVAQRIVELERGRLASYPGGYGDYLEKKALVMEHEERVEQNRQNMLRREREWLSRGPKARSTKQKARIGRAHALEAETPANAGRPGRATLTAASATREGKTILELEGLSVGVGRGASARTLNAPFDLILTSGDRVGIIGPNGSGKTSLVRAILAAASEARTGEPASDPDLPTVVSGRIVVGKNTRVAYLDQARAELDDAASVFDDVRGEGGSNVVHLGIPGKETIELRSYLELFLFDVSKQRQKVGSLSGGERARVALAKVLRQGANLLVLDEPTNDLDLPTLGALEELLEGYPGSTLLVTHDRALLDRVATSTLAFEPQPEGLARVERHAGGYQDYVLHKAAAREAVPVTRSAPPRPERAQPGRPATTKRKLTYGERIELEEILDKVAAAEEVVTALEAELANPQLYATRAHEAHALNQRLEAARAEATRLTARWEELESKKG